VSFNTWILNQKRLEILRETFPKIRRVAVLGNASSSSNLNQWEQLKTLGGGLGLDLLPTMVSDFGESAAFEMIVGNGAEALTVLPDATFDTARERIVALAATHNLITMYKHRAFVGAGGLMSYGPNLDRISYRAAAFVNNILKGAQPADLPVEQPTALELLINLKVAKALSISMPDAMLGRADEVIE